MAHQRQKLTDAKIAKLAPAAKGKRYMVTDLEMPNLIVRVTSEGTKSFLYQGRFPGRSSRTRKERTNLDNPVRRLIGVFGKLPGESQTEHARKIAREWADLLRQGRDPAEVMQEARAQLAIERDAKFSAVLADWDATHLQKLRRGAEMKRQLDYDCLPTWGNRAIASITREEVVSLIKRVGARAPYIAHNVARSLHSFFGWALNEGCYGMAHHPMDWPRKIAVASTIGQPRRARERELEDLEIRAYWKAATELGYPYGDFFKVLLLWGHRRDEVSRLSWSELDLERGIWQLPSSRFKGQRKHVTPFGSAVVDILSKLPRFKKHPKGFIFTTTYGAKAINSFGYMKSVALHERMLKVIAKETGDAKAEIEQWGLHDLRRTMRTRMSMLGVDYVVAELCVGHKLRGLHAVYDRYSYIEERRKAYDLYAKHVLAVVDGSWVDPWQVKEAAE